MLLRFSIFCTNQFFNPYHDGRQTVVSEGEICELLGFIVEGTIRVYKQNESGKEITLYRISAAESCILSTACIMSSQQHKASAIIEEKTTLALVQTQAIRH